MPIWTGPSACLISVTLTKNLFFTPLIAITQLVQVTINNYMHYNCNNQSRNVRSDQT